MEAIREEPKFPGDLRAIIEVASKYCDRRSLPVEARFLRTARPSLGSYVYDEWDGGVYAWAVRLEVDISALAGVTPKERDSLEENLTTALREIVRSRYHPHFVGTVTVMARLDVLSGGRGQSLAPTNQGRVRPDSLPSINIDGIYSRSHSERRMMDAFLVLGFVVKPIPLVLYRDGERLVRLEPDLEISYKGRTVIVEVDGPSHTESPADAQVRLERLRTEGAIIERVRWQDCQTEAAAIKTAKALKAKWEMRWRQ